MLPSPPLGPGQVRVRVHAAAVNYPDVLLIGFQLRDFATHAPDELRRNEQELLDMLAAHRAVPYIGATFDLADTAAALRHVADGKAIGKVVLDVSRTVRH